MENRPPISVVIIGRNEGERLVMCLESVKGMNYPAQLMEVIFVDSGSTDGSAQRAQDFGAKVISFKTGPFTAARARNAGWRCATAELILFLDGDTILARDFVDTALQSFGETGVAAVFGNRFEIAPTESIFNRVLDYDWPRPVGKTDYCGGDVLFRLTALKRTDGYREDLIAGEEPEMCSRLRQLGYSILHIDCPMTGHDLAMTKWKQYWRRASRTGHAYAQVSELLRHSATPLWGQESKRNYVQGSIYLLALLIAAAGTMLGMAWIPIAILAGFSFLVIRTSLRVRSRVPLLLDRTLYSIHSHIQQIPILFGQVAYRVGALTGKRRTLIEYHVVR